MYCIIINCETSLFSTIYGNKGVLRLVRSGHFGFCPVITQRYAFGII